jgi:hypothetical protein
VEEPQEGPPRHIGAASLGAVKTPRGTPGTLSCSVLRDGSVEPRPSPWEERRWRHRSVAPWRNALERTKTQESIEPIAGPTSGVRATDSPRGAKPCSRRVCEPPNVTTPRTGSLHEAPGSTRRRGLGGAWAFGPQPHGRTAGGQVGVERRRRSERGESSEGIGTP